MASLDLDDNTEHSVRADLWHVIDPRVQLVNRTEGAHRRMAGIRGEMNDLNDWLNRVFTRYEQTQQELEAVGVVTELRLAPPLRAAYGAWKSEGPKEHRLELTTLAEAPIPDEPA